MIFEVGSYSRGTLPAPVYWQKGEEMGLAKGEKGRRDGLYQPDLPK